MSFENRASVNIPAEPASIEEHVPRRVASYGHFRKTFADLKLAEEDIHL